MKALFTFRYDDDQMQMLEGLGIDVTYIPETSLPRETSLEGYDFMVCYAPFSRLNYDHNQLQWIQLVSKGVNQVPAFLRDDPAIVITNNVSGPAIPIGELIIAYILEIYKNARYFYNNQQERQWIANPDILEITDKTIGFLGTGRIAQEAAVRLQVFNANIIGVNTSGHTADGFQEVRPISDLPWLLESSDIVVSTLPATEQTWHLLNDDTLGLMRQGSTLINISRGSVIDEPALIQHLQAGRFRGVALDVFETEPLPKESPLWSDPRVIVTPHNALYSDLYNQRVFDMIYHNVQRFLAGEPLDGIVDYRKGY